jgi:hypothetical protein
VKRVVLLMVVLLWATPAWPAKKITVQELESLLASFHDKKKTDAEIATELKQVELSEELTRTAMSGLAAHEPGPLTTEQIYVLEARSAMLAPPASDLPGAAAPDAAAQSAMLARAADYVAKTYAQLPTLAAVRTTLRFQDNVEAMSSGSGLQGGATEVVVSAGFSDPATFVHFINSTQARVVFERGAQLPPREKDKTPWGANKMIALEESDPSLNAVFATVQSSGGPAWLRWETVDSKRAGVFAFKVAKKKSRMDVSVCCFPNVDQAGVAMFYTSTTAQALSQGASSNTGGVAGDFQTNTEWHGYKAIVGYHGELFIDPDTGVVLRMITQAEMKPGDVVHRVDTRVDYGAVQVGAQTLIVPVKTIVDTEVAPNGDSNMGPYKTRRTLFTSEFKDYQPAIDER